MFPSRQHQSRYLAALRRSHITRIAAVSAALVVPGACAASDSEVFGASHDVPSSTIEQPSGNASVTTDASAVATTTEPSPATTTVVASTAPTGPAFPAGAEVEIGFTYSVANSGGRVHNPYVAVWVEDTEGNLVRTVGVWFQQSEKGTRWLRDLRQWAAVATGVQIGTTVTGATRAPGEYSLVWDGTDDSGDPVPQGEYVLLIETAREHGPYQTTSATVTVSDAGFAVTMPDDGELVDASATMTV